jgi:hypothetical protein
MTSLDREHNDRERARRSADRAADATPTPDGGRPPLVSSLGNAAVQRLLRSERDDDHPAVDGDIEQAIEAKRGGGRPLDREAGSQIGQALGADLSDVRVHDDADAHALNEAVSADAFTNGSDVFFRQGRYQPGTSEGDRLLAHELTHVVQQRKAPAEGGEMRVSSPEDAAEREASQFSERLASTPSSAAAPAAVAREEMPEEEELQLSAIAREETPEEEELQLSRRPDAGGPSASRA